MPYIYTEQIEEGQEEADVITREEHEGILNGVLDDRDSLVTELAEANADKDRLSEELNAAKTKFANAFLDRASVAKSNQGDDIRKEERPMNYAALFAGRTRHAD